MGDGETKQAKGASRAANIEVADVAAPNHNWAAGVFNTVAQEPLAAETNQRDSTIADATIATDGARQASLDHQAVTRLGVGLRATRVAARPAVNLQATRADPRPGPPRKRELTSSSESKDWLCRGSRVHRYEIIRELGRGGMGRVLLARDTVLGRRVALKFLLGTSKEFNQRFLIEARTTAQLSHESIVIIHEAGEFEGAPFMALEYLEGESLAAFLADRDLPDSRVVELMIPVARALEKAHTAGIVHRDLKPENIFISHAGQIKVLDFGIAKLFRGPESASDRTGESANEAEASAAGEEFVGPGDIELTREGALVGTLPYMSPEQFGNGVVDHRSDIWAVGIMLHEMLTGAHPIKPLTPQALMVAARHPDEPLPSIASLAPDLAPDLITLVDSCLQKRPSDRLPSATALLEALESFLPGPVGRKRSANENPFPGLVAFQEQDADRFYGRSRDITRAVAKLREQALLAIVGPSGVGKSSLVRAGLVPTLKFSGEFWESFILRPGRDPIEGLAIFLQPICEDASSHIDEGLSALEALKKRIREEPGYIGAVLRKRAREKGSQCLIFIDQFEELYTLVDDIGIRSAYVDALLGVADDPTSPLRIVISMRSDFLDRAGESETFLDTLTPGLLFLLSPDRDGIREALTKPIEAAGYSYESQDLVTEMLDSLVDTPSALPLLQFAAAKLWDQRDRSRKLLSEESYRKMGGVAGTLATHADEVLACLPSAQQKLARAVFIRLVTADGTRALTDISELRELSSQPEDIEKLVSHLVQARLLVVQPSTTNESPSVEIVHESLISKWPKLRLWLEEGQEDAAFFEQLRNAARQWEQQRRDAGLLWRGEAYSEAARFKRRFKGKLTGREQEFLDAVVALGARSQRIKRYSIAGGFAFLLALIAVGIVVLFTIRKAEQEAIGQAEIAEAEKQKLEVSERKVRDQLTLIQEQGAARVRAESEALKAAREKQEAKQAEKAAQETIAMTNEELKAAYEKATAEKNRAEIAQREAEEEKKRAEIAQKEAETERARALSARSRAEKSEAELRVENERLKAEGRKINRTLD